MTINRILIFIVFVTAFSCNRNEDCEVPIAFADLNQSKINSDLVEIEKYLQDNGLEAEVHSAGFRYRINNSGTGAAPNVCNFVVVGYEGRLLNGTIFDSTTPGNAVRFQLNQLIPGWQAGIPLINGDGSITLYLPSPLGYGSRAAGSIPANSILIFDITLFEVQ